jgi:hypothetical protein
MAATEPFQNPFRPGAGHAPPYLAGRDAEKNEYTRLLSQDAILDNVVLTGLRGIGKTVLLDEFRPLTLTSGWLWVGSDLSESSSVSEDNLATRLITDLSTATAGFTVATTVRQEIGFRAPEREVPTRLDFDTLRRVFTATPGLIADKLRTVLELTWAAISAVKKPIRGIVFAYDEAQNLADHAAKDQYPLSLLLDVFQSIQKRGVRFMLLLTGLPTLFPKLVDARTFSERMFRVLFLKRLGETECRDAILKPIEDARCPVQLDSRSVRLIVDHSGGYPYFVQFICREVYDHFLVNHQRSGRFGSVRIDAITRKLDSDFFAGRWARVTDRQRDLLHVIAYLDGSEDEFTVQEIVEGSKTRSPKPFSSSHVNQILAKLAGSGLVYKNRHGKYSFAVPLFGKFVLRQMAEAA